MKVSKIGLSVFIFFIMSGCSALQTSNKYMSINKNLDSQQPGVGRAVIIFERENVRIGEFFSFGIWDVSERQNDPMLVGFLHPTMKVMYEVEPGEHYFMVEFMGRVEMLRAKMKGDSKYYVLMKADSGWKGGSCLLYPIKKGQNNPIEYSNFGVLTSSQWERDYIQDARNYMKEAYAKWDNKSEEDKAKLSLSPEDGR